MKNAGIIISYCICIIIVLTGSAAALCVTAPRANLRCGPGPQYKKTWEVYKYMPFEKVGVSVSGTWYAVKDVDGDIHWIYKKLVSESCRCAVVTTDNVAARTGPGTKYAKSRLNPANKYYCFRVMQKKEGWVKLKDQWGNLVWIHKKYLWIR